jgi:hypothetical protein
LRQAVWLNLARAEQELRRDESLAVEILDFDRDGNDEVWFHSSHFSALVSPHHGGTIVEYTVFRDGVNYADVLTRRREAYHFAPPDAHEESHEEGGIASIHHLEESMKLIEPPPVDRHERAILVDSVRPDLAFEVIGQNEIVLTGDGIEKRISFSETGEIAVSWKWTASALGAGAHFSSEVSLTRPLHIDATPDAVVSTETVETVAKSEKGLDRTVQGEALTFQWDASLESAELRIRPY